MTFQLSRDPFGQLALVDAEGRLHTPVVPVRAFPITAPREGIAICDPRGQELVWIDALDAVPEPARRLLAEELDAREFMPEVRRIRHVSADDPPATWDVETDRGPTRLVVRAEEDVRRVGAAAVLIRDAHGVRFLIRDREALDAASRRVLERYL